MPAATEIMFCSATPMLKNRSGCRSRKSAVRPAPARSAVSTTIRGSVSPRSASSWPATKAGIAAAWMPLTVPFGPCGPGGSFGFSAWDAPALPVKVSLICCPAVAPAAAVPVAALVSSAIAAARLPVPPGRDRLQARLDLRQHVVVVRAGQVAHVPVGVQLHPLHAAALDRVGDDHLRRAVRIGVQA